MLGSSVPAARAAVGRAELARCRSGAFSTEEDFMTKGSKPADGDPRISDGDLLSRDGFVCARNADLLQVFATPGAGPLPDLGLDAVDVIDVEKYLVALSTELDHPRAGFAAGDLLVTNGAVVPNVALVAPFGVRYDVGLDEVKFIGKPEAILRFLEFAKGRSRGAWLEQPGSLQQSLKRFDLDIWFSTEGTAQTPNDPVVFLDGDVLSAATGAVVIPHDALLPASVPAGIPARGVDFGLDAFAVSRDGNRESFLFSTELVHGAEALPFTDGDVLRLGDGVVARNWDLVAAFEPATRDLGLDALFIGGPGGCENKITNIGGLKINELDFGVDGLAALTGVGDSPPDAPGQLTQHPHGRFVHFWGTVCEGVKRFRVVYRKVSDGPPGGPNDGTGIAVTADKGWQVRKPLGSLCIPEPWFSDADGWFDAAAWRSFQTCDDVNLTVWYTHQLGGGTHSADANDLYRVWLAYETTGGVIEREARDHLVRLDNIAPLISQLRFGPPADPRCPSFHPADMPVTLVGEIVDDHFWGIRVSLGGDSLPPFFYPRQNYYNPVGVGEFGNLDSTGTTPDGSAVPLRRVNVADLGTLPPAECCYGATVRAYDRTIVGRFLASINGVGGDFRTPAVREAYFAFAP
jgi:hypothetical protein